MGKENIPLESRRWTPLLETLEGCFGCNGGSGADVFLSKREGRDATGKVPAEKEVETFITFAQGQNGNSMYCLFGI